MAVYKIDGNIVTKDELQKILNKSKVLKREGDNLIVETDETPTSETEQLYDMNE